VIWWAPYEFVEITAEDGGRPSRILAGEQLLIIACPASRELSVVTRDDDLSVWPSRRLPSHCLLSAISGSDAGREG
jgi:hypothetical protein